MHPWRLRACTDASSIPLLARRYLHDSQWRALVELPPRFVSEIWRANRDANRGVVWSETEFSRVGFEFIGRRESVGSAESCRDATRRETRSFKLFSRVNGSVRSRIRHVTANVARIPDRALRRRQAESILLRALRLSMQKSKSLDTAGSEEFHLPDSSSATNPLDRLIRATL